MGGGRFPWSSFNIRETLVACSVGGEAGKGLSEPPAVLDTAKALPKLEGGVYP